MISRGDTIHGKNSTETFGTDDRLRILLDKNYPWIWESEQRKDFGKIKKMLTEAPCPVHFAKDK